jgi:hypothetical protein
MRSAGLEVRHINRGEVSARLASEFAEKKPFQPPLEGTQQEIDSHNSSQGENDLG